MTPQELKKLISESPNVDWFNTVKETFSFQYANFQKEFTGIAAIYTFVMQQAEGWEKYGDDIPEQLKKSKNYFRRIATQVISFVNSNVTRLSNDNNLQNNWNSITVRYIYNPIDSDRPLLYDRPETVFLTTIPTTYFNGAYSFIIGRNNFNANSKEDFIGCVMAYEFLFKEKSDIVQRRDKEEKSLAELRSDFLSYLSKAETQLTEHLSLSYQKYQNHSEQIDVFKSEKEAVFREWYDTIQVDFTKFNTDSKKKIEDLEATYQEKLRLEKPALYWERRGNKLQTQGWWALGIMVVLLLLTVWSLAEILWAAPKQIYESFFGEDKSAAIRWSIVYVTLISFIAFCIRALTKVMFSSFHLARDSEERHTLTYFYLALLKDSKVDEKDRQLIIQSLFSRAETGLLKEDSSPTMPNDIVGKLYGK